ncbi:hypothetical protein [Vibrio sp. PNB23_22_7]
MMPKQTLSVHQTPELKPRSQTTQQDILTRQHQDYDLKPQYASHETDAPIHDHYVEPTSSQGHSSSDQFVASEEVNHDFYSAYERDDRLVDAGTNKAPLIYQIIEFLKALLLTLLIVILIVFSLLGVYRAYRWITTEPIQVEKVVEKVVEKPVEVIKEVEVEKQVIPEECTQIRRNGRIFMQCDGVTIDGAESIKESGVDNVPELFQ